MSWTAGVGLYLLAKRRIEYESVPSVSDTLDDSGRHYRPCARPVVGSEMSLRSGSDRGVFVDPRVHVGDGAKLETTTPTKGTLWYVRSASGSGPVDPGDHISSLEKYLLEQWCIEGPHKFIYLYGVSFPPGSATVTGVGRLHWCWMFRL